MSNTTLDDESPMPWGPHQGKRMVDVPDTYLLSEYEEGNLWGSVFNYVLDNLDAIKKNVSLA